MTVFASKAPQGKYLTQLRHGVASWLADADQPIGDGQAPDPHALLDSALAACTAITLQMYAERKGWPLQDVQVEISHEEADGVYRLQRKIALVGELDAEARQRLIEIANKCPIHKALTGRFEISTEAV